MDGGVNFSGSLSALGTSDFFLASGFNDRAPPRMALIFLLMNARRDHGARKAQAKVQREPWHRNGSHLSLPHWPRN